MASMAAALRSTRLLLWSRAAPCSTLALPAAPGGSLFAPTPREGMAGGVVGVPAAKANGGAPTRAWDVTGRTAGRMPFSTNSHDHTNLHQPEQPNNSPEVPWDFTPANYDKVAEIVGRYPSNYKAAAVIPLLDLAQQQNNGWLSISAMNRVAAVLGMADMRVYEVATFYTMFNRSKMGKYHVMVCGTTPCMLRGSRDVYAEISNHLGGIEYGDSTPCGTFTLSEMECMGCCVNAPMIAVADYTNGVEGYSYNYYEDLRPGDAKRILDTIKQKGIGAVKIGSQYRGTCEPADMQTTLTSAPPGPFCRPLVKKEADAKA